VFSTICRVAPTLFANPGRDRSEATHVRSEGRLIKSCRSSAGSRVTITISNQSLAYNLARTEALCRSSEKAHIGAHGLEAYGTFCGTP
jgi:hypothetical protein